MAELKRGQEAWFVQRPFFTLDLEVIFPARVQGPMKVVKYIAEEQRYHLTEGNNATPLSLPAVRVFASRDQADRYVLTETLRGWDGQHD